MYAACSRTWSAKDLRTHARSGTSNASIFTVELGGYMVHLIDTPGFDDTDRSEMETLRTIIHCLCQSYTNGIRLSGVLYLHRIADNRFAGSTKRSVEMLRAICGQAAYPGLGICTTMWHSSERETLVAREEQLASSSDFFGDMLKDSAKLYRHADKSGDENDQTESAQSIILDLLVRGLDRTANDMPAPITLLTQSELVDLKLNLDDTTAGRLLTKDLRAARGAYERELNQIRRDLKETVEDCNERSTQELRQIEERYQQQLMEMDRTQKSLSQSLEDLHEKEREQLVARINEMELEWHHDLAAQEQAKKDTDESLEHLRAESAKEVKRLEDELSRSKTLASKELASSALVKERRSDMAVEEEARQETEESRRRYEQMLEQTASKSKTTKQFRRSALEGVASGTVSQQQVSLNVVCHKILRQQG
ncbi:MAG: hypothetical protein M1828_004947 [Chrysothrix sp. TS-e1954]|nr:MAG: hypothetical protein M1828_004947 [Chrysothrix sp. TS-e1954]